MSLFRSTLLVLITALALLIPTQTAHGQCDEPPFGWQPGYALPGIPWGNISSIAVLPGGDLVVGGWFSTAGVWANNIARLNPGTGVWSRLGDGLDGGVSAISILTNGDIVVAGYFSTAGGTPANRIARYNPITGEWSALGSGLNGNAFTLIVSPQGEIIVGGSFSTAGGVPANNVARYNPATGEWSALGTGVNGSVTSLTALPEGAIIVGGSFSAAGGVSANNIARFNPTTGAWSPLGIGVGGTVRAVSVLPSSELVVGGSFYTAGGVPAKHVARYNPITGAWSALGSGVSDATTGYTAVETITALPGGDVIVGGSFSRAGGVNSTFCLARYNLATGAWSALAGGIAPDAYRSVSAVAVLPGGDVVVGGDFLSAGGASVLSVARYTPSTGVWSPVSGGLDRPVYAMAPLSNGNVVVGGYSSGYFFDPQSVAQYNPTTGVRTSLGSGISGTVSALLALQGGDLIAGGEFDYAGGAPAARVARYNPTNGLWSPLGSGIDGDYLPIEVNALAVLQDGDVVMGGNFSSAGGVLAQSIARYNPITGMWAALGTGVGEFGNVQALAVLPNGDVVAGGYFSSAGGVLAENIARYNPATGAWSALGSGFNGIVYALAVLPNGDIVAGGRGFPTPLAHYESATHTWTSLEIETSPDFAPAHVDAIAILPGGDVIVGGNFMTAGGTEANNIVRYNPTTGEWTALGSGTDGIVKSLVVTPLGDLIVGGEFVSAGIYTSSYFARYTFGTCFGCPPCAADYDNNGGVDGGDLGAFFLDFEAGETCADVDQNGGVDGGDLGYFFTVFEAGGC